MQTEGNTMQSANDFQWDLMVMQLAVPQLRGLEFNNYGLNQIAQVSCGQVLSSVTHDLLTQRLHEEDWRERFLAK